MKENRLVPAAPEPVADALFDPCVKCTICMEACPVAAVTDAFPGPKMAGPDSQRFRGRSEKAVDGWVELCSGCRSCQTVCPSNVPIADINALAKARRKRQLGASLATRLLTNGGSLAKLGCTFAPMANGTLRSKLARSLAERLTGISAEAPIPSFASKRFSRAARPWRRPREGPGPLVALFHGCHIDTSRPDLGRLVVHLLEKAGCRVVIPRQDCCGVALAGAGDLKGARRLAARNLRTLAGVVERADYLVFTSPSCQLALSTEYVDLLHLEAARAFTRKAVDLLTLLESRVEERGLTLAPLPEAPRLAYHAACHLKALGIGLPAVRLLRRIPGLSIEVLDAGCCGLAGTFGMKAANRAIALEIGRPVAKRVLALGAGRVVSECEGCRMMIESMTEVPALHPAEVLAEAAGIPRMVLPGVHA